MYYSCLNMVKNGRSKCKNKSVPTHKMDEFVVKHISNISNDPRFLQQFIEVYSKQRVTEIENITLEQKGLTYKLASFQVERDKLQQENNYLHVDTIISIQNQISTVTNRLEYLNSKKTVLESSDLNAGDITVILNKFFPIWNKLTTDEQNKILDKLFEQIFWDSQTQSLDFNYSPLGIQLLQNKRVFDNAN